MSLADLQRLIASGESETLELKKSTAELGRAGESICGFLNGTGGRVVIGVSPGGRLVGQEVSDRTLQDVAAMLRRFEPPAPVEVRAGAAAGSPAWNSWCSPLRRPKTPFRSPMMAGHISGWEPRPR
ncbi:MAG: AlbA family DNA-binding domain-containing protein [Deferrisomatales bacterium]